MPPISKNKESLDPDAAVLAGLTAGVSAGPGPSVWPLKTKTSGVTRRLVLAMLLINLMVLAFAAWALFESRLKFNDRAITQAGNIALLVDHDIANAFLNVDLTLRVTAEEFAGRFKGPRVDVQVVKRFLDQQLLQTPDLEGLFVMDENGIMTFGTNFRSQLRVNTSDRKYFQQLRQAPHAGLVIDGPLLGRVSGKRVLILARALHKPDGTFAGVVAGSVALTRLGQTITSLQLGAGGTFTLFDDERRIIMRYQDGRFLDELAGTELKSATVRELLSRQSKEASYLVPSAVDGVERMFSYRKIEGLPLSISIGVASSDYLSGWYAELWRAVVLVFVFVLATLLLSWFIYRAWRRQALTLLALREAIRTRDAERQMSQTIFQSSPFAIYTRDRDGIVTSWNSAAETLFGWEAHEIIGKKLLTVPPDKEQETRELRDRVLRGETILKLEVKRLKRDGTLFDLSTTVAPLRDAAGAVDGYLAIVSDITDRKAAEQKIEFLAYRDVLTGLPNRLLLLDRFKRALSQVARSGGKVALLFLDLDNFKTINDSLGHAVGDALLKEVALRLNGCVRETDTISRQGGDEFLIVLSDLRGVDAVTPVLTKIRERLQLPFEFEGHELSTSASIGVALCPDDGSDFDVLLKKADTAMYRAKDAGRNQYRYFDEQMNIEAVEHLQLKNGLRRALAQSEFELHYQPQFDLRSGAVIGAEALIRWRHPEKGLVAPGRFIPVAEESGMIVSIGDWVIHEACRQGMAWRQAGLPAMVIAVNLSAVQFSRGDVQQTVTHALQASGFDPQCLELEMTESLLIRDTDNVLASVQQLKQLGVKLSIDDFGTGYSSLSYLKRFAVDKLKIDQSFVRDLAHDPDDAAIVRAIIQMAASLNLRTIAEGVEDAATAEQLRQFACDEVQGYHFGRPMPALAFAEFLTKHLGRAGDEN